MSKIFNPKFQTKNIYNINPGVSGIPNEDEIFQWFTVQNDIIYNNFRISGQNEDRKYPVQVTVSPEEGSSSSSQQAIDLSGFLTDESITFDTTNDTITFSVNDANDKVVSIPAIYKRHVVSGAYSTSTKYLTLTNNDNTTVNIDLSDIVSSDESQKYVVSGVYNANTRSIVFTYNDNNTFSVDLSSIVVDDSSSSPVYSFTDTASIDFSVVQDVVTANVILSDKSDNYLTIVNDGQHDGLYLPVDNALSSTSENPVQNKKVYEALEDKFQLNYLLFRIPDMQVGDTYHLYVQFSTVDDFSTVTTYNTLTNYSMFKMFTGLALEAVTSSGISYSFSGQQVQLDLTNVSKSLKYFRFHWTSDEGQNFGRYGYGNRQSNMQIFDAGNSGSDEITIDAALSNVSENPVQNNVIKAALDGKMDLPSGGTVGQVIKKTANGYGWDDESGASSSAPSVPNNEVIDFTSSNSAAVSWTGNVATFTHTMNCIPIVTLFNSSLHQIMVGIEVVSASSFTIDFEDKSIVTGTWKAILSYGAEYTVS